MVKFINEKLLIIVSKGDWVVSLGLVIVLVRLIDVIFFELDKGCGYVDFWCDVEIFSNVLWEFLVE